MSSSIENGPRILNDLITSTLALLSQFSQSLSPSSNLDAPESSKTIENPPNALHVLGDSAKLVKAHTTKLSLLAINKPFTPSAITKILRELAGTCLPAMMSAVQICEQEKSKWGSMMSKEVQARVRRVFKEMEMLLGEVRSIGAGNQSVARRDSLSSTGVVWESCDALIELELLGLGGLALQKAEQYQETIKDAIQELEEWKDGDDLDFEGRGDKLADSDDEAVDGDRDSIEDMFHAANSMPKNRPELKSLLEETIGKSKKIAILYQAVVKRRVKTIKTVMEDVAKKETVVTRLDELMLHLRTIPHQVDELASNFYDLDEDAAKATLGRILTEAREVCDVVALNWNGQEDEFTAWLQKWNTAVGIKSRVSADSKRFTPNEPNSVSRIADAHPQLRGHRSQELKCHNASIANPAKPNAAPSTPTFAIFVGAAPVEPEDEGVEDDEPAAEALPVLPPAPPVVVVLADAVPVLFDPAPPVLQAAIVTGVKVWLLAASAELQMSFDAF